MENVLSVKDLCKNYGKSKVLKGVNLDIPKGSIFGLVGRNGAGKTTLMRIVTGLAEPTSGTYSIGGVENTDRKILGVRRRMGSITDSPALYKNLSAYDNIKLQYINLGMTSFDDIPELLELVDLKDTGKKKAGKFSLGMRQRLGIAMAMTGNPEVLILDEPINGLDPQGIIQIRDLLTKLNREMGVTIIISSHILSELSKLATDFAFVEKGKVVKEARAEAVETAGGLVSEFYSGSPEQLIPILNQFGLTTSIDPKTGIVFAKGYYNLTQVVKAADSAGINIARVVTKETDLETYFVNLVGGESYA